MRTTWGGSGSGTPTQGHRRAHFDYDGLGQLLKSAYRTHTPTPPTT